MVNCLSEVNTPFRLKGRTMRSASTPSTEVEIDHAVGMSDDPAEPHALG